VHGVALLEDSGFSSGTAAFLLSFISWGSFAGKFAWGPPARPLPTRYLGCIRFLGFGIALVALIPFAHSGQSAL